GIKRIIRSTGLHQAILNDKLYVNDSFISSEHQRFCEHLVTGRATESNFKSTKLRNIYGLTRLDRCRPMQVQTRIQGAYILTKARYHSDLSLLDHYKATGHPQTHNSDE